MHNKPGPILKDLVLLGGGHSHVAVLKRFGMRPEPGVRLTLITRDVLTPYSGMLPGYIAGHYSHGEAHIDLRPLAQFAGARLYHDEAVGLDLQERRVLCARRPPVAYDLLSIDIGSRPARNEVPGADRYALPIKPIDRFLTGWQAIEARARAAPASFRIAVVGAGAGGVELTLALHHRLHAGDGGRAGVEFHLFSDTAQILPTHNARVQRRFRRVLSERGIRVHTDSRVTRVEADTLHTSAGASQPYDALIWVTQAAAAEWLPSSGLALTEHGFIAVNDHLQSISHADVFAAGDVATMRDHPRPKSGVMAVRAGPPLTENLRRAARGSALQRFVPQRQFLSLISTGNRYAVASRGPFSLAAAWLWRWKDWIDRRWMRGYTELPDMAPTPPATDNAVANGAAIQEISTLAMRCGGCGAKVGSTVLARVISRITPASRPDILIGLADPDDAAVIEVPKDKVLVQSVDFFRAFIDDAYLLGRVAANHSLSDLYAMGAEAQTALALAVVPYGLEAKVEQELYELLAGANEELVAAGAALIGGHSSEGAELSFGLSVNGLIARERLLRKAGMQDGDALILTKALGTGTLFAADMRRAAKGEWIDAALASMLQSNRLAADILARHGARALTDVTGFGLLGHLVEMTRASQVDAEIELDALPAIYGATETLTRGIFSSLQPENLRLRRALVNLDAASGHPKYPLLFDPQTSGGLLAALPAQRSEEALRELRATGYGASARIGRVLAASDAPAPIRLKG